MAASVAAHLLMQDALATAFGAEALPVAVDAKLFTALRIGTGPEHRLGRGLRRVMGFLSIGQSQWSAHLSASARSKSESI